MSNVTVQKDKSPAPSAASASRRRFLRTSALMAGGAAVTATAPAMATEAGALPKAVPDWSKYPGDDVVEFPYGVPSEYEKNVVRRTVDWLTPLRSSSVSFTPIADLHGIITPNGLHFERHHGGTAHIDPAKHEFVIHGLVEKPLKLSIDDLMRYPSESNIHFIECPANTGLEWRGAQMEAVQYTHGMVSCCEWTGVKLSTLLNEVGVKAKGKWLLVEGGDASGMSRSLPLDKALDDVMIAYAQNGERLRPEQGYPMRLIVPGWEGNMQVKWLRRIEIGDQPWHHREETSKYTDLMEDGTSRRFTWVMEAKSVITTPSPEKPMKHGKGFYNISGLAWSGRGRIKRVDVSVDGGKNWIEAKLDGLVLPKSLTRFSLPFEWNGSEHMLQSRAIDETGYVQPTFEQLRKVRGDWSIYHNNGIQTWLLRPTGKVENVQLG